MPDQALAHLERVADLHESPHLPHVMTDSVEALNGLLRTLLGGGATGAGASPS